MNEFIYKLKYEKRILSLPEYKWEWSNVAKTIDCFSKEKLFSNDLKKHNDRYQYYLGKYSFFSNYYVVF